MQYLIKLYNYDNKYNWYKQICNNCSQLLRSGEATSWSRGGWCIRAFGVAVTLDSVPHFTEKRDSSVIARSLVSGG